LADYVENHHPFQPFQDLTVNSNHHFVVTAEMKSEVTQVGPRLLLRTILSR
jgi:hypothetical protein